MNVYEVNIGATSNLFLTPELAARSIAVSYSKIAKTTPNAMLTQCTVVFDDKRHKNVTILIEPREILERVEHL